MVGLEIYKRGSNVEYWGQKYTQSAIKLGLGYHDERNGRIEVLDLRSRV
jgi:hypothetical protein